MIERAPILACERKFAASSVIGKVERDGIFCGYASLFGTADLANDVVEPLPRTAGRDGPGPLPAGAVTFSR